MITTGILNILYGILYILTSPLRILSDVTVDPTIATAIATVLSALASLNNLIPLAPTFAALGIVIAIELLIGIYKIIMWFIRRLPTQN